MPLLFSGTRPCRHRKGGIWYIHCIFWMCVHDKGTYACHHGDSRGIKFGSPNALIVVFCLAFSTLNMLKWNCLALILFTIWSLAWSLMRVFWSAVFSLRQAHLYTQKSKWLGRLHYMRKMTKIYLLLMQWDPMLRKLSFNKENPWKFLQTVWPCEW